MVFDLEFGRRIYDKLGRFPRFYGLFRWIVCLGRESTFQQRAIQLLELKHGNTVLDLACGNGVNFGHLMSSIGPSGKIIALDYSTGMLAHAQKRAANHGWNNLQFINADAATMVIAENSLDAALCTFGLSSVPDDRRTIENVWRALKPGGRFVVFDAKPFTGINQIWNPLIGTFFKYTQNWNGTKDIIGTMRKIFGNVAVDEFNSGCNYIASSKKDPRASRHCS